MKIFLATMATTIMMICTFKVVQIIKTSTCRHVELLRWVQQKTEKLKDESVYKPFPLYFKECLYSRQTFSHPFPHHF